MENEILIYGEVGTDALSAQTIKTQLAMIDTADELVVRIDSPGGSVFQGFSIFQAFQEYPGPKRCIIESAAFSIASYIAMAFDEIEIADNGYLMIHNPSVTSDGDDEQHTKDAELLAKLKESMVQAYSKRSGISEDDVRSLMKNETYFNATEASQSGFVTRVLGNPVESRIVAMKDHLQYRVVASLFSGNPGGDSPPPKESPMAEDKKIVAASVKKIKALFPKAKPEFIVRCMDDEMTEEEVLSSALEELQAENEELQAKVAAFEEAEEEARAKAEEEEETAKAAAEEEETAKAAARGADPIARAGSRPTTASAKWNEAIDFEIKRGLPRARAVQQANRKNPGLRSEYLAEVNAR